MSPQFEETRAAPPQHSEAQLAVIKCGRREGLGHRVKIRRGQWPPRTQRPNEPDGPHVDTTCIDCGAFAQIYAKPDGTPRGHVTVILVGTAEEAGGQLVEEASRLIDEAEMPPEPSGFLVEHPEAPRKGARRS